MKRGKFTEAQIAFVLKQAEEGTSVAEICRKAGIAEATFYNWRKKYAGLMPSEMKRLKMLDEENLRTSLDPLPGSTCLHVRKGGSRRTTRSSTASRVSSERNV